MQLTSEIKRCVIGVVLQIHTPPPAVAVLSSAEMKGSWCTHHSAMHPHVASTVLTGSFFAAHYSWYTLSGSCVHARGRRGRQHPLHLPCPKCLHQRQGRQRPASRCRLHPNSAIQFHSALIPSQRQMQPMAACHHLLTHQQVHISSQLQPTCAPPRFNSISPLCLL